MKLSHVLISTSLICFSLSVSANRPAMEDQPAPMAEPEPMQQDTMPAQATVTEQQVSGDALEIQPGETLDIKILDFPRRGMSAARVENELGRPIDITPAVGEPPISSWSYEDRKVFFEGDIVIHVVAN